MHPANLPDYKNFNHSEREANQDDWNLFKIDWKKDAAVDAEVSLTSPNVSQYVEVALILFVHKLKNILIDPICLHVSSTSISCHATKLLFHLFVSHPTQSNPRPGRLPRL